jgi:hypothetical protein
MSSQEEEVPLEQLDSQDPYPVEKVRNFRVNRLLSSLKPLGIAETLPLGLADGALAALKDIENVYKRDRLAYNESR